MEAERHDRLWKERVEKLSAVVLTSPLKSAGKDSSEIGGDICYRPWLCNPCLKKQPTPPYILTIDCQSASFSDSFTMRSDPFYSHPGGYKFQLHVVVSLDHGSKYIGARVHLLEGGNDDNLMFPFKGTLTVSLMNQRSDREHQEKALQLNPQFCRREDRGTLQDSGSHCSVVSHCRWKERTSNVSSYVADGRLYIKVLSVDFDHDYMSTCVPV